MSELARGIAMASWSAQRRISGIIAVAGAAASLAATAGTAHADTRLSTTATSPHDIHHAAPKAVRPADSPDEVVTFTQTGTGATFTCTVTRPIGDNPNQPQQIAWRAVVFCGFPLRMQGTSSVYVWGQPISFYPGSSYDNTGTQNETVGRVNAFQGEWGINNNVLLFVPAGWTAAPPAGCYNQAADQIHCTNTLGPFPVL